MKKTQSIDVKNPNAEKFQNLTLLQNANYVDTVSWVQIFCVKNAASKALLLPLQYNKRQSQRNEIQKML